MVCPPPDSTAPLTAHVSRNPCQTLLATVPPGPPHGHHRGTGCSACLKIKPMTLSLKQVLTLCIIFRECVHHLSSPMSYIFLSTFLPSHPSLVYPLKLFISINFSPFPCHHRACKECQLESSEVPHCVRLAVYELCYFVLTANVPVSSLFYT